MSQSGVPDVGQHQDDDPDKLQRYYSMCAFKCMYLLSSCQPSLVLLFFLLCPKMFFISFCLVSISICHFCCSFIRLSALIFPSLCCAAAVFVFIRLLLVPAISFFFCRPGISFLLLSTSICIHGQVRASPTCSNGPSLFLRAVAALNSQDINSTYWWGEEAQDCRGQCQWPRVRRWSLWWDVLHEHWSKDESETLWFTTTVFAFYVRKTLSIKVNGQLGETGLKWRSSLLMETNVQPNRSWRQGSKYWIEFVFNWVQLYSDSPPCLFSDINLLPQRVKDPQSTWKSWANAHLPSSTPERANSWFTDPQLPHSSSSSRFRNQPDSPLQPVSGGIFPFVPPPIRVRDWVSVRFG